MRKFRFNINFWSNEVCGRIILMGVLCDFELLVYGRLKIWKKIERVSEIGLRSMVGFFVMKVKKFWKWVIVI